MGGLRSRTARRTSESACGRGEARAARRPEDAEPALDAAVAADGFIVAAGVGCTGGGQAGWGRDAAWRGEDAVGGIDTAHRDLGRRRHDCRCRHDCREAAPERSTKSTLHSRTSVRNTSSPRLLRGAATLSIDTGWEGRFATERNAKDHQGMARIELSEVENYRASFWSSRAILHGRMDLHKGRGVGGVQ